jgi:hypothetical protein
MKVWLFVRALGHAGLCGVLLLCSCGEMDSLFPVYHAYQVSAARGSLSLDDYALIKEDDEIEPRFVHPIHGDRDVQGLRVVLQNARGDSVEWEALYKSKAEGGRGEEGIISVEHMSGKLPPFRLPRNLETGAYVMVFQVLGAARQVMAKNEKAVYYMGKKDFSIAGIKASLPGVSSAPYLFPPGTPVLLEIELSGGGGLDPYVAWYNGRTCIAGGRFSEGAGHFLWEIPGHTGFLQIRAEAVPFPPVLNAGASALNSSARRTERILRGKMKTLSLAVSDESEMSGSLVPAIEASKKNPEYILRHYRFEGNLRDAVFPGREDIFPNDSGKTPCWDSAGTIYGLVTGPDDIYEVPPFPLNGGTEENYYSLLLNVKPLNVGVLCIVSLGEARLELSLLSSHEGKYRLELKAGDICREIIREIPPDKNFTPLTADFGTGAGRVRAVFGEEEISLDSPPGAMGFIQLGQKDISGNGTENEDSKNAVPSLPVMILDELALLRLPTETAARTQELYAAHEAGP